MGLAERRQIAKVDEGLEAEVAKLRAHLGSEIVVEISKESFPENKTVLDGYDYYKDYGFPLICRVLIRISCDEMGRDCVNDKIKKVLILNTAVDEGNGGEKSMTLTDGVLTIEQGWNYNTSQKLFSEDELVQQIESLL